jgi:ABC-type oligopeptide transport system ATPase subunit
MTHPDPGPISPSDARPRAAAAQHRAASERPLLSCTGLRKTFHRRSLFGSSAPSWAVDDVDLAIGPGETLGLVGESGCGKSTLARCLAGIHTPTVGQVEFDGRDILHLDRRAALALRRDVQMVFQDPYASLNPKRRVGSIIGDPLAIHSIGDRRSRVGKVKELMEQVGLNPEHYNRFPGHFSGGQRQRIGIARALALDPKLLICDEPVSALDVSVQAQILNLLTQLQVERGLACLFISHDLSVVRHVSDRVAVMYRGRIVETASVDQIFDAPQHDYTRALLAATPVPDPDVRPGTHAVSASPPGAAGSGSDAGKAAPGPDVDGLPTREGTQ